MTRASLLSLEPHFPIYTWDPQTGLCPVALMRVVQSYWKVCGVLKEGQLATVCQE